MIYANIEAQEIRIDDTVYEKAPGIHIHMHAKEMIQTAAQYTKGTIVLLATDRKDGDIYNYFNLFLTAGENVPKGSL